MLLNVNFNIKHPMKKIILLSTLIVLSGLYTSCKTSRSYTSTPEDTITNQVLVDSILQKALDREALYTILSDIKPVSSLSSFSFPIANTDSVKYINGKAFDIEKNQKYLDKIQRLQNAVNSINIPDLKFFLLPYASNQKNNRILQLYVARESAVNKMLNNHKEFYGQFGWTEGVNPEILVTANEYGEKYDRYRGFGYFFGYPEYAVDFYVNAALSSEKEDKFLERNFFQIPVFERDNGYFVYAYPKDYTPTAKVDSALYHKSVKILNEYKDFRKAYLKKDGKLNSLKLIQDFNKK